MRVFLFEIAVGEMDSTGGQPREGFYIIADNLQQAVAQLQSKGLNEATCVRELDGEERKEFRYLKSAIL